MCALSAEFCLLAEDSSEDALDNATAAGLSAHCPQSQNGVRARVRECVCVCVWCFCVRTVLKFFVPVCLLNFLHLQIILMMSSRIVPQCHSHILARPARPSQLDGVHWFSSYRMVFLHVLCVFCLLAQLSFICRGISWRHFRQNQWEMCCIWMGCMYSAIT